MKLSRRLSALLAAAAVALACIVVPAFAAKPKPGHWAGPTKKTTKAKTVDFDVIKSGKGRRVKAFRLHDISVRCTPNGSLTQNQTVPAQSFPHPVKVKKNGRFKLTDTAGAQTVRVKGRFIKRRKAKGTVVFTQKTSSQKCTTGKLKWSAKLK